MIVGDGAGHGSVDWTKPAKEAETDVAGAAMALDHHQLDDPPVHSGHDQAVMCRQPFDELLGHDLTRDETDDAHLRTGVFDPKVEVFEIHHRWFQDRRRINPRWRPRACRPAILGHHRAADENPLGAEVFEIGSNDALIENRGTIDLDFDRVAMVAIAELLLCGRRIDFDLERTVLLDRKSVV